MILAIDIGNTTVALGGLEDGRVCFILHMATDQRFSRDEYLDLMRHKLSAHHPYTFEGAVLTSVVPQLTQVLAQCAAELCGGAPVIVTAESRTGLTMGVKAPEKVGRDRIVDAAYAAAHYPLPVVTVDLGTATTFSVVDEHRVFRGGIIAPGVATSLDALGEKCAQLPKLELACPETVIGGDTVHAMLSGAVMGAAALLDGMKLRIEAELGRKVTVVVTGGLAPYVIPSCNEPLHYDPDLLMKGLDYLYRLNTI